MIFLTFTLYQREKGLSTGGPFVMGPIGPPFFENLMAVGSRIPFQATLMVNYQLNIYTQSWTTLFRAFSSHQQP